MDIFGKLKFTQEWIDLGIITPEKLDEIRDKWLKSDDRNTEHYRWRAFLNFSESSPLLDDTTLRRL
jgi:hypothetical protein